jgi:hypothetical protein
VCRDRNPSRCLQARRGVSRARSCRPGLNRADLAHNPEVAGSNPAPATKLVQVRGPEAGDGGRAFLLSVGGSLAGSNLDGRQRPVQVGRGRQLKMNISGSAERWPPAFHRARPWTVLMLRCLPASCQGTSPGIRGLSPVAHHPGHAPVCGPAGRARHEPGVDEFEPRLIPRPLPPPDRRKYRPGPRL